MKLNKDERNSTDSNDAFVDEANHIYIAMPM